MRIDKEEIKRGMRKGRDGREKRGKKRRKK